jgi:RES domain-containing protein
MDVDPVAVRGDWWRHVRAGLKPTERPEHPSDGRWQTGATAEAVYLGEKPETVWAEWYRFIAEAGIPPDVALPRDLWRWEIDIDEIADLSDRRRLSRVGLSLPLPHRSNWSPFQAVGDELFRLGWCGLLVPSAARSGDLALCLFRTGDEVPGAEPVDPPERIVRPPLVPTGMST